MGIDSYIIPLQDWTSREKATPVKILKLLEDDTVRGLPFTEFRNRIALRIDGRDLLAIRRLSNYGPCLDIFMHSTEPDPQAVRAAFESVMPLSRDNVLFERSDLSPPRHHVHAVVSEFGQRISLRGSFHERNTAEAFASAEGKALEGHHMHLEVDEADLPSVQPRYR